MNIAAGLAIGAGVLALLWWSGQRAEAAPPVVFIPTVGEISGSENMTELDTFYELINELKVSGQITEGQYYTLYDAYLSRANELIGV